MKKLSLAFFSWIARLLPLPIKQALYRFPLLARLIRGSINAAVSDEISEVEIAAGDLKGYKILINLKTEKSRWLGTYEPELAEAVRQFIRPGDTVYDLGANIGYVSLLLAHAARPNGKLFAFEALPANVNRIRRNAALNGLQERITVVPAAVLDKPGQVTFYIHESVGMGKAAGSAGRSEQQYQSSITVPATSLDEFVFQQGNPPPQAIKIDIEGGEVLALPGMEKVLSQFHPLLFLELHGPESEQVAWQTLTRLGYHLYTMQQGFPEIETPEQLGWKAYLVAQWAK